MRRIVLTSVCALFALGLFAQPAGNMSFEAYAAKSIYSFIRYINWPTKVTNQDFVIGVVGDKNVYEEVNKLLGDRNLGNNTFRVKFYKKVDEFTGFHHIVFIDAYQNSKFDQLMAKVNSQNTLVISEVEGGINKGSMINFVAREGRVQFQVSADNIVSNGLNVDSRLVGMAIAN